MTTAIDIHTREGVVFAHPGIEKLRACLEHMVETGLIEELKGDLEHVYTPELTGRKLAMPAGAVIVTRVHKFENVTFALKGSFTIVDQNGVREDITAPAMWVTKPGTQRAIYVHEDMEIANVFPGNFSHLDDPIDAITFDTMADYEAHLRAQETACPVLP